MRFKTGLWWKTFVTLVSCAGCLLANAEVRADTTTPQRVVSANLCADQLLLALAVPAQIVSLSPFARDKTLSLLANEAARFPSSHGSAEELMDLKPDLVLIGSFDSRHARAMLERKQISFIALEPWQTLDQGREQILKVAERLGQRARGDMLLSKIDEGTARLKRIANERGTEPTALVLHRRGYAFHSGVLVELASIAGLKNAAETMGLRASGTVALERIIASPPDYLIVTQPPSAPTDQGEAFLAHPALSRLFPADRRLVVPDNLSICAGPSTPPLIDKLADEIQAKVR